MVKLATHIPASGPGCPLASLPMETEEEDSDALHQKGVGLTPCLALIAAVGTLGNSVPTGYNLGVINMPQALLKSFVNETQSVRGFPLSDTGLDGLWSCVVSSFLAGAMLGSLCAGYLANKIGRRGTMFVNCILGLTSAILFALSDATFSVEVLLAARILSGFCGGLGSSVAPLYLMETAPVSLRGAFGVMQQLGLTLGILISQVLGQKNILGTADLWPLLLSLYGAGMLFGILALPFCPSSPSYLYINKKQEERALADLVRLRGVPLSSLEGELRLLRKEKKLFEASPEWTLMRLLKAKELRQPLGLVCAIHAAQQLSGISAVFYYSTDTFMKAGMNEQQSEYGSIGAGVANVVMACLAVPLVTNFKRRQLISISLGGGIFCLFALTASMATQHLASWIPFATVGLVLGFVLIYGIGMGPLPFMMGIELLQQGPRAAGMGLGAMINWMANFFVAISFPYLQMGLGEYVFLAYAVITVLLFIVVLVYLPETKGLDSTDVFALFQAKRPCKLVINETDENRELVTPV